MSSEPTQNAPLSHKNIVIVVVVIATIVSVSGVFMGMRQTAKAGSHPQKWVNAEEIAEPDAFPVAPRYSDIPQSDWKANHDWVNSLENLPRAEDSVGPLVKLTDEQRVAALHERTKRRAYDGAPPTIPHPIKFRDVQSCSACHGQEAKVVIAGKPAPTMSHPYYANCTQCHAPEDGDTLVRPSGLMGLVVDNSFAGVDRPGKGTRAYDGAPPTIPHRVSMRQNCMSCHGPGKANAITTSHPHRKNCLQCHAPDAQKDNSERFVPLHQGTQ